MKKQINEALKEGYHIDTAKTKFEEAQERETIKKTAPLKLSKALEQVLAFRDAKKYSDNGTDTFRREIQAFIEWGKKQTPLISYVTDINFHNITYRLIKCIF